MELFKSIFIVGGLKEFVRLLSLVGIFFIWLDWLGITVEYFTKKIYLTKKIYYDNKLKCNIRYLFSAIFSYLFLFIHGGLLICILIWAWR